MSDKLEAVVRQSLLTDKVVDELDRHLDKWGVQDHTPEFWAVILGEEFGEVCRAIYENDLKHSVEELIQTAAVCIAMAENIERNMGEENE